MVQIELLCQKRALTPSVWPQPAGCQCAILDPLLTSLPTPLSCSLVTTSRAWICLMENSELTIHNKDSHQAIMF